MPPPLDIALAFVPFEIFNLNDHGVSAIKTQKIALSPAEFMRKLRIAFHMFFALRSGTVSGPIS
jgi:hypothetical protein